jgi:ribosome-binding protein aMBF1 (putative translation factor)
MREHDNPPGMSTDDLAKPLQLKVKLLKSVEAPK